jgi:hypothetical protein
MQPSGHTRFYTTLTDATTGNTTKNGPYYPKANRYLPVLPWFTGIPPSAHRPLPQRPGANSGGHLIRNRPFEIVLLNGGFV